MGGRRILLADDNDQVRRVVKRIAELNGYEIVEASTGAEVRRLAVETRPALVVLDIRFPDADGRDILAQLKTDPQTASLPVLVWSARDPESDRRIALELGAEDYVEKGEAQELVVKITRVLLRLDPTHRQAH
jgi:two-component system, OmpR family, KDP operon response regulator KdpE